MHAAALAVFGDDESALASALGNNTGQDGLAQWERVRTVCATTQPSVAKKWSAKEIRDKFKRLFAKQTTTSSSSSSSSSSQANASEEGGASSSSSSSSATTAVAPPSDDSPAPSLSPTSPPSNAADNDDDDDVEIDDLI